MIDVKLLLNDFENVSNNISLRNIDKVNLIKLKELTSDYKISKQKIENMQCNQNNISKQYAIALKNRNETELKTLKNILDETKNEIKILSEKLTEKEKHLNELLHFIPNMVDVDVPTGKDETDNVEIAKILIPKKFNFNPKEHWELANLNNWIDLRAGAKIAKSRFSVLRKKGAILNKALINYMLDFNRKNGFELCSVPIIVNEDSLFGTGQLPKFRDDMFKIERKKHTNNENINEENDLYLISTSEISLTNLYKDEIIDIKELPIKLCAATPCFRKEAGSAGKDTRGIIRQHQFDKVEIVAITKQEDSEEMQKFMVKIVSDLLYSLKLPHRLVQLCSGDMGFSASNTIDIEVWMPGQNCYREISSISNCKDFQARRAKIRYKSEKKNKLAHTLNGSSLAIGRTIAAIMENFQEENGQIIIPEVLEKYM